MLKIENTPAYRAHKAEKELAEKINKMTHSLIYLLKINRYDVDLVLLIGKDGDRNNEAAVKTWVTDKLCCPSCMRQDDARTLSNDLRKALLALADDIYN